MATTMALTIQHDDKTYAGFIATIRKTSFGEKHSGRGIVTANLDLSWDSSGVGACGDYCLDAPLKEGGKFVRRQGTAVGMDFLMRIMEVVGVEQWEDLPGQKVVALFDEPSPWGSTCRGIAGLQNSKVLIPSEFFAVND